MKVFLDANVLFSAANSGSGIAQLVRLLGEHHEVITSDYSWAEVRRNIYAKRPAWREGFDALAELMTVVSDSNGNVGVELPENDRPILATAQGTHCDYLVTGDRRHFGHLFGSKVANVKVLTPLMMAKVLATNTGARKEE